MAGEKNQGGSSSTPRSSPKGRKRNRPEIPDALTQFGPPSTEHERPMAPQGERDPLAANRGVRAFAKTKHLKGFRQKRRH
jgi:hypothetical protein